MNRRRSDAAATMSSATTGWRDSTPAAAATEAYATRGIVTCQIQSKSTGVYELCPRARTTTHVESALRRAEAHRLEGGREATAFRELLPKVCEALGGQFRIVTGDAGLCARENAALVTKLGRWYVFGLKGNQPHLYGLACEHRHYSIGKPLARTVEKYRGHTIERELYARDVAGDPEADIEDAQQLWYVCQATYDRRGECIAAEQRYFVTAIPAGTLTRDEELAVVRLHCGIENGCHWTMDVVLGEDDAQPCQASRASIETVSWLRIIGYNAVSAWRQQSPRRDRKPISWARATETPRDALLLAQVEHCEAIQAVT
jgi:hypothetical protein